MAARNKLSDLRDHLFTCLEDLNDPDKNLDETIKRSQAIGCIADRIIGTAKVEVDMVNAISSSALDPSAFFDGNRDRLLPEPDSDSQRRRAVPAGGASRQ